MGEGFRTETYDPRKALRGTCRAMHEFSRAIDDEVEAIGKNLAAMEWAGEDTSFARSALLELRWRTNATGDLAAAKRAHARLRDAMQRDEPPNASVQDAEGSFAPGTDVWFLKLDRSTDQLLARGWPWRIAPYFLELVDDPIRMYSYLEDLAFCDVVRREVDTRKELNLAVSVIARLVMRAAKPGTWAGPG